MNDIPAIFFEGVVSQFFNKEFSYVSALAGLPGHIASQFYAKKFRHCMRLRNGRLEKDTYLNCKHQELDIETPSKKLLHYTEIAIHAGEEVYSTDPKAMERVLSATKGTPVILDLQTSNISKEIAKCVESIRFVFVLQVKTKIPSDVLKLMRSLVKKNTLNEMEIGEDAQIEDETAQLLIDLLKQKQFYQMFFYAKCSAALKEIIASWGRIRKKWSGKSFVAKNDSQSCNFRCLHSHFKNAPRKKTKKQNACILLQVFGQRSSQKWC